MSTRAGDASASALARRIESVVDRAPFDRAHWGMGIASRALHLLLGEVTKRPLVATAATSNGASLRVLQKCGFVVERVQLSPATDRYPECEEAVLVLR